MSTRLKSSQEIIHRKYAENSEKGSTGMKKNVFQGFFLWKINVYFVFCETGKLNTDNLSFDGKFMKRWCHHLVLLAVLTLLFVSGGVSAQDAGMSDVEIVDETDAVGEKMIYAPGEEVRYVPKAATAVPARDSVVLYIHDFPMQQATMKSPETAKEKVPSKQKDDSILTFNFLYYIIQKYKLQDIID